MSEKYGVIPEHLNWEHVEFTKSVTQIPVEHRAAYMLEYGLPADYGKYREDFSGRVQMFGHGIFAVGKTPEEAIVAMETERGNLPVEMGDPLGGNEAEYDWGFRYHANGTSMKAAGQNVPGGVILTWKK
jgi:hypothetical protein